MPELLLQQAQLSLTSRCRCYTSLSVSQAHNCFVGRGALKKKLKAFDSVDHNKLWKILKRWEYQNTWPASWEICMQVKKQQLELDME